MDFHFSPEEESFRQSVRYWLKDNLPEDWEGDRFSRNAENRSIYKDFAKRLATKKWVAPHWPVPCAPA